MADPFTTDNNQIPAQNFPGPGAIPASVVTIGTQATNFGAPDDLLSTIKEPGDGYSLGIFESYRITNHYIKDKHTYMAGMTSPGGFQGNQTAFFKLSNDTLLWICQWQVIKSHTQPEVPAPNPPSGWVLLDEDYVFGDVGIAADGVTPIYRLKGEYVYGCVNPNAVTVKNTNFPRPPWLDDIFDRSLPESKLQNNLKDGLGHTGVGFLFSKPGEGHTNPPSPGNPGGFSS